MKRFLQFVIRNPVAVILALAMMGVAGVFAMLHLPTGLFPGLDIPVVNVICHQPGAAAEDMELMVSRPIEDRLRTIPGIRRVSSTSLEGICQITAEFDWGVSLGDARQFVQGEISAVQGQLPAGVEPRLENIGTTLQEVAGYVVTGGDPVALRAIVQTDFSSRLMNAEGVSRVEILGGDDPAYIVRLRPEALARLHLSAGDVATALKSHNLSMAADFIERGGREYLIRGDSRLQSLEQVRMVPLVSGGGRAVFLGDIAAVRRGRVPKHYRIHGNGVPAVAFLVSKQPAANTIDVAGRVDRELESLSRLLPQGAKIRKFYDQSEIVVAARDSLVWDLLVGAFLAVVVLYFFMGSLRPTLVVAATIPLALLATVALMQWFGQSFNVVTLSALTLAVGMVVDDAIVVAENVTRRMAAGTAPQDAALAGAVEIAGPDASGTFTTAAAFAPLLLVGGIAGLFIRPFGLVLSSALLASLVVSLTFVPMMLGRTRHVPPRRVPGARLLAWVDSLLQRVLRFGFAHRGAMIGVGVATLALGGLASLLGPVRILPPVDEGAILVEYTMPPGTSLEESNRIGNILEREALAQRDVVTVFRRTGSPERYYQIEGVNRGEMMIKLAPRSVRKRTPDEVMAALRKKFANLPGVVFLYHQPTQEKMEEGLSGLPAIFGVTIFGPDANELTRLAAEAEAVMAKDPALANIVNNTKIKSPRIVVEPDPMALAQTGTTPAAVFQTVRAARFGIHATDIVRQRQTTQVLVELGGTGATTLESLRSLPVPVPNGAPVPLEKLARVRVEQQPAAVTRLNGQRQITILAEVEGDIPSVVKRLGKKFEALDMPEGYSIAFTGQYEVLMRTIRDLALVALAAVALIYLIMVMQFRSWTQPLLVLVTVPLAMVGAIVLLAISRVGLDISVGMGALTLVGIAVNNAIVLLDYANRRAASGLPMTDALSEAVSVRLRPIAMTAATTIFALLPVALNPDIGSRIFQPFAVTVIGGLLSATAVTLVFVPVLAARSPE